MKRKDFIYLTHDSEEWELIKYFKPQEFQDSRTGSLKIALELVRKLDQLREMLGKPIVINSGYRTPETNRLVGGSPTSSHLYGLAVDIKCLSSATRFSIIQNAMMLGFRRIGVANNFVHLDIDPEKVQDVMWTYRT